LSDFNKLLEEALIFKDRKKYEESVKILEALYKDYPKSEKVKKALKEVLFAYGGHLNDEFEMEHFKAAQCFKRIIEIDPSDYRAHYNLGIAYFEMERFDEALDSCNKALEIKPDYKHCYYNIGLIYETKEDFKKAQDYYQKALEIDPKYGYAFQAVRDIEQKLEGLKKNQSKEKIKNYNIEQLKSLLSMSKRIQIGMIQELLGIDKSKLLELLISWGKSFQCELDGDYLNLNKSNLPKLLKSLEDLSI